MYNSEFVNALKEALNGLRAVHAVGEEWCSYIGQIPTGGVPYCGQEVLRETYSALWAYAQNQGLVKSESEWQSIYSAQGGNVPFYSSGDGSSTFRVPRLVGYVRGASSQSESGDYVKEGLPDIHAALTSTSDATISFFQTKNFTPSGAFSIESSSDVGYRNAGATSSGYPVVLGFDASKSNPIYGNSAHVTPETSYVLFGVYAFGVLSAVDALDAATLATAVARVESNMSNKLDVSVPHVVEDWRGETQWYRKWSDGRIEQGGKERSPSTSGVHTVTFPIAFSNTDYFISKNRHMSSSENASIRSVSFYDETENGASTYDSANSVFSWYAVGY